MVDEGNAFGDFNALRESQLPARSARNPYLAKLTPLLFRRDEPRTRRHNDVMWITLPSESFHTSSATLKRKWVTARPERCPLDDNNRCKLLHEILNGLTVVVGQCELIHDSIPEVANRRLRVIEERAKKMAELILQRECPAAQIDTPDQKRPPESVGRQAMVHLRKWASMAAD
jgi:hypothetical protein